MDVPQMQAVVAIEDTGSFSKAAEVLGVSVPTIKNQVDALEFEIGFPLFSRTKRGSAPTPQGRYVAERARAVLTAIDDIIEGARALELAQSVVLACQQNNLQPLRDELCADFMAAYPGISLRYKIYENYGSIFDLLMDGVANASFCLPFSDNDPDYAGFCSLPCAGVPPLEYRIVCLAGSSIAGGDALTTRELLHLRHEGARLALGCHVCDQLEPFVSGAPRVNDPYDIVNHCLDGGLCLIDNFTAINDARLVTVPIADVVEPVCICAKTEHSDAVEKFMRFCVTWHQAEER